MAIDKASIQTTLEDIRQSIERGDISYGEIATLQSLAEYIEPGDVELLEWAGVPEFPQPFTYRELRQMLSEMSEDILDQTVTVFLKDQEEFIAASNLFTVGNEQNVLDPGHLVLVVK